MKFLLLTFTLSFSILFGDIIKVPTDIRRIQDAVDASNNGDTILVEPGQYFENLVIDQKAILLTSEYILNKDPQYLNNTWINGSWSSNVIQIIDSPDTVRIMGLIVTEGIADRGSGINVKNSTVELYGVTIENNGDPDNKFINQSFGAGLYAESSSIIIDNCSFLNNKAPASGGGLLSLASSVVITNSLFYKNLAFVDGGAFWARMKEVVLENCVFAMNSCKKNGSAININSNVTANIKNCLINDNFLSPAVYCRGSKAQLFNTTIVKNKNGALHGEDAAISIFNSIVGYNRSQNIFVTDETSIAIGFSAIEDGLNSIDTSGENCIDWMTSNISTYPQFTDSSSFDFTLSAESPCIDKGVQDTVIITQFCQDTIFIPTIPFEGAAPDMGYHESPYISLVDDYHSIIPKTKNITLSNYPNPFNSETVIEFSLKESIRIKLDLYDASCKKIKQLEEGFFRAGKHYLKFNLNNISTGIYFVEISSKYERQVRKITFIK